MKKCVFLILIAIIPCGSFSQVAISSNGANPDPSSILDLSSSNRGLLFPRMTTAQRDAITSPARGLLIYNTTTRCLEMYEYDIWQSIWCAICIPPAQPSLILGSTNIYPSMPSALYSVNPVQGVSYAWTYTGNGFTFSYVPYSGTSEIYTAFSATATSGILSCTPHYDSCNTTGTPRTLSVTVNFPCTVGSQVGGGIVFYVGNGKCYVTPTSDQSNGAQWYNGSFNTTSATGIAIGTGQSNTATIIASQGPGYYAAKVCDTLTLGGFTDWFLPSWGELDQMYIQQNIIGGFNYPGYHWGSTEIDAIHAYSRDSYNGGNTEIHKNMVLPVRCIRGFPQ